MQHFFRKIRSIASLKEGGRSYARYALGELVLVIAGILIALQINNWNEDRIQQRQIAEYAHSLIQDLERDVEMAEKVRADMNLIRKKIDTLADYTRNKSLEDMRNIDLFYLMRDPFYRSYHWNRTTLDQMKSSGALREMKNQDLAAAISTYDALTHHLEDDFQFDRSVGTAAVSIASQAVDMNYPNLDKVVRPRETETFSFPRSEIHTAYKNVHLDLLTDDVDRIKVVVNAYLILADIPGMLPRTEVEMPDLIAEAQELITMLKAEYPD